jgi:hypothetical protein
MMEAIAKHRYARTSAQKARLVADQVRGLSVTGSEHPDLQPEKGCCSGEESAGICHCKR